MEHLSLDHQRCPFYHATVLYCARGKLSDTFTASMWQVQTHLATHDQFHINDVQMFAFVTVDINVGMHGTLE